EPFTLYGLLAETVETPPDRSWVEFTLHPEARFADGSPVTVEDVLWSMETLAEHGLPGFTTTWAKVGAARQTGPRSVRFDFTAPDRELPLILGLRPILSKAHWEGVEFAASGTFAPLGSGPYRIAAFEPNRQIVFEKRADWWGRDLTFNRGRFNLQTLRYDVYSDGGAAFEAFTAGIAGIHREADPIRWAEAYDFPALRDGRMVRATVPHARPSGLYGFVFNTRRPPFDDIKVREALTLAFNFEWVNAQLNRGALAQITSPFSNSELAHAGPATAAEEALLAPFAATLPAGWREGVLPPPGSEDLRNRRALRTARGLLEEAGWRVVEGRLFDSAGTPLSFEIMLRSAGEDAVATIFADALRRLGIEARLRIVDGAQYEERRGRYDFDMILNRWGLSLSPGNEQRLYWGREGVETPGTRNYAGIDDPAVEAMIDALLAAEDRESFETAVRALDRVLAAGRYVIPLWYAEESWLAHDARLRFPARTPLYGDWIGFFPDVWWFEE
ncbi:MAG: extracellular solute-binding protein, partial [Pseudomonadota bacterium]